MTQFLQAMQLVAPLEQDADLNAKTIKIRLAQAIGIDTTNIILTEEEKAERQAQQMAQVGGENLAASAGAGMGSMATSSPEMMGAAADTAGVDMGQ